jgi:hypothetical protein
MVRLPDDGLKVGVRAASPRQLHSPIAPQDLLASVGLQEFTQSFVDQGVLSVDDMRRQSLHMNDEALFGMGFRTVQIARLRQAMQKNEV